MPSLLYFYNMLPVMGAGDRFTDISIVPHPKGFRKVVEKVLQLRKGPLCEGTPAERVGERPYLAAFYENVSPSVSFADSAPPLALRATSPVSGESVSQREPLETARPIAAYRVGADARPYRTDCKRTYIKYIRSVTAGSAKPCCFFACFARWLQTVCRGIYTVQLPKHPGCLQLVAEFI